MIREQSGMAICPECAGRGKQRVWWDNDGQHAEGEKCPLCRDTGSVEVQIVYTLKETQK